jgi:hypothetical protein
MNDKLRRGCGKLSLTGKALNRELNKKDKSIYGGENLV